MVIPCQWKFIGEFSEGLAKVEDNNQEWGYIDKTGKVVIPYQWKDVGNFSDGLAAVCGAYYKWGFIDKTGKVVIPCQWKYAGNFSEFFEGLANVMDDNGVFHKIDKTGKIIE